MTMPLLATKFHTPTPYLDPVAALRAGLVPRPRLVERLDEGLCLGRKLTLISAPPGFGKTTLVSSWIAAFQHPQSTIHNQVAWLSLDEADNDPARFFVYLIAALQLLDENAGQAAQTLLGAPQLPPVASLLTLLIRDIADFPPFVFVLDDYHLIHTALIHDAIEFLINYQPPQMHLCLVTRTDPPLSLPRLRVRGQMTEIRADDLRFTIEEAAAFLKRALGLTLDANKVTALEARTEGWIAGLQLAALSLRGREDVAGFIDAFSGSNRHVIDYLAAEVLAQQPDELRDFLCQTSILDQLTTSLCQAVTGKENSAALLRQLQQANLFLTPLDQHGEWYCYHRLFADFLRTELAPQHRATLHLKAARWHEENRLLPQAVEHALASGDVGESARLIAQVGDWALSKCMIATVLGWLDALPDEIVRANGELASHKAWALFVTGRIEEASSYVRSVEACLREDSNPLDRGQLLSLQCNMAEPPEVVRLARKALDLIGTADPFSRGITLFMLGDAQDKIGDVAGAIETFQETLDLGKQSGEQLSTIVAAGHLAISLNSQGQRHQALAVCHNAIEQYVDTRGRPFPQAGLVYVEYGILEYEANNLPQARLYLQRGLELGQQSATVPVVLYAMEGLAQLEFAMGESETALSTIREAHRLASRSVKYAWRDETLALETVLEMRRGNLLAAEHWAASANLSVAESADSIHRYEYQAYAHLLLAQNHPQEAQAILANLERSARRDGRQRDLITIHILQSLAERQLGHKSGALDYLGQALRLAMPEDYVRAFLDEDPVVAELLVEAKHIAPRFVDKLLAAFSVWEYERMGEILPHPHTPIPPHSDTPGLIDPLSERELEVLHLLATDLSAPEIAERLIVAASTVRSHIKHIYEKLNTHSRYEAVERAKALGFLKKK
ncbi:MAG: hypothetical protein JXA33_12650 [Anaerolineae bacterium]|nr:hypothetical protein [Anaerolineae bacterium]